jgi:membrane associated rhomboid family serine protease
VLSLIPLSDVNPTRRFPVVTVTIIALNVIVFFTEPGLGTTIKASQYFYDHAPVPCQLVSDCPAGIKEPAMLGFLWAVVYSTFLHAGLLHIAGNMLFLWVFGNNIEDYLGRAKFVVFYLAGGLIASFAHIVWALKDLAPDTTNVGVQCFQQAQCSVQAYVPSVGASGAVAAVMGAYIVLYPKARVNVLVPIFIIWTVIQMSAIAVLGLWFVYQFLIGAQELAARATEVAWMAHVGGFAFGALAIYLLGGRPHAPPRAWQYEWRY